MAPAALQEVLRGCIDRRNRTGEIRLDQVEFLDQVAAPDLRHVVGAGVDHDRVDAAQAVEQLVKGWHDALDLADVQRRQLDAQTLAVLRLEFITQLLEQREAPRGQPERVAAAGHFHRQRPSDARRSASNHDRRFFRTCHGEPTVDLVAG